MDRVNNETVWWHIEGGEVIIHIINKIIYNS